MDDKGNVVLAYTSDSQLMLDCDLKTEEEVIKFARKYAKFHDLGSVAVFKTSVTCQVDMNGRRLGNYCIIFGKVLPWDEVKWHVQEVHRLGMVNKGFTALREFGSITIRVSSKNNKIPPPKPLYYFRNGDSRGITAFVRHWKMCRSMGKI